MNPNNKLSFQPSRNRLSSISTTTTIQKMLILTTIYGRSLRFVKYHDVLNNDQTKREGVKKYIMDMCQEIYITKLEAPTLSYRGTSSETKAGCYWKRSQCIVEVEMSCLDVLLLK